MILMKRMKTDQTKSIRLKTEGGLGPGRWFSVRSVVIRFIRIIRVPFPGPTSDLIRQLVELDVVQVAIELVVGQQLLVVAGGDQLALVDQEERVARADRRDAVRQEDRRAARQDAGHGVVDEG